MDAPLKWHGGKSYLASKIVALMPRHTHYVEPYAGGLSVLLAKASEGVSEVVNDINYHLTNFWAVLRDEDDFADFRHQCEATPFCEAHWRLCQEMAEMATLEMVAAERVTMAHAFFTCCRQSLAGRMKSFAPLSKSRTRRGMNEQASAWLTAVEGLPEVHERLKRVIILNRPALQAILSEDGPDTLFYVDCPYHPSTRSSPDVYVYEMSDADHVQLLEVLVGIEGKFLLSGYHSPLYDKFASLLGWPRVDFHVPNHAAGGGVKRRMCEVVWANFPLAPGGRS